MRNFKIGFALFLLIAICKITSAQSLPYVIFNNSGGNLPLMSGQGTGTTYTYIGSSKRLVAFNQVGSWYQVYIPTNGQATQTPPPTAWVQAGSFYMIPDLAVGYVTLTGTGVSFRQNYNTSGTCFYERVWINPGSGLPYEYAVTDVTSTGSKFPVISQQFYNGYTRYQTDLPENCLQCTGTNCTACSTYPQQTNGWLSGQYCTYVAPCGVPSQILNLTATTQSSSQINLSWTPPATAVNYDVYIQSSCAVGGTFFNTTSTSNVPVTGLNANTTYYFNVKARNSCGGLSPFSNCANATTQSGGCTTPPTPNATSASNITSTSFQANWNSSNGATSYHLDVSTNSSFSTFVSGYNDLNVGNTLSYNVTGLNASSTYYYRLRACCTSCSVSSNIISLTTQSGGCTTPPTPTAISATSITSTSFQANWNSSNGATSYRLDVSTNSSFSSFVGIYNDLNVGNVLSYSVTGLTNGTIYYYRVRACCTSCSSNSNIISLTTSTCTTTPTNPTAIAATNVTVSSFQANWNSVSGANAYKIDVSISPAFTSFVTGYQALNVGNVLSTNVTGLTAGTIYYYRLYACCNTNCSVNGNIINVTTTSSGCIAPSISSFSPSQTVTAPSSATFTISPAGTSLSYQWQTSTNNGSTWSNLTTGSPFSGVNTTSLYINPTSSGLSGNQFRCFVSSACTSATATSTPVILTVNTVINQYSAVCQLPYSIVPFSNPFPLINGNTSSPAPTIKICADGSKATRLTYTNNDVTVSSSNIRFWIASDPFGNYSDTTGYFLNPYTVVNNVISANYQHPLYVSAFNLPFRKDSIFVVDYTTSSVKFKIPIEVYRAPVLFIHGFNGASSAFASTATDFKNTNYYSPSLLYLVDYSGNSLQNFATNATVVPKGIYNLLYQSLANKYSTGKVDLVAHSMGGLLSRLYLQNNYNNIFKNDVNKLITLNSPHSGSHLASWAFPLSVVLCGISPLYSATTWTCNGAVVDMQTFSYATDNVLNSPTSLANGHVPCHTISSYINNNDIGSCVNSLLGALTINGSLASVIFNGHQMDGVVRDDSQRGGLIGLNTSSIIYQCHLGAANNPTNQNEVKQLLSSSPNGGKFSLNGFNPPNLRQSQPMPKQFISKPTAKISLTAFVDILNPTNSSSFIPNQNIVITINADTSVKRLFVLAGNATIGVTTIDTLISSSITNVNYTIPSNAIGTLEIDVIGLDPNNVLANDSVTFNVNANATLDSIEIVPPTILVPTNLQSNFQLIGHYSDGIPRDITTISGVQQTVANTGIAQIVSNGIIEGITIDSTILTASYQGISKDATVYVYEGDSLVHALFTSNTNSVCDSGQIIFSNISTGHPLSIQWLFPNGTPSTSTDSVPSVFYNSVGTYDVSLIATYSNKIDTLILPNYVTVDTKPVSTLSFNNDTIYCSYTNGFSYQWYYNNVPVDSNYQYNLHPDSTGYYYVDVLSYAGCLARSDTFFYSPTSINYFGENSYFSIYPNPTTQILNINGHGFSEDKFEFALTNALGQQLIKQSLKTNSTSLETKIDLKSLPIGLYFLEINSTKNKQVYKVVKN